MNSLAFFSFRLLPNSDTILLFLLKFLLACFGTRIHDVSDSRYMCECCHGCSGLSTSRSPVVTEQWLSISVALLGCEVYAPPWQSKTKPCVQVGGNSCDVWLVQSFVAFNSNEMLVRKKKKKMRQIQGRSRPWVSALFWVRMGLK